MYLTNKQGVQGGNGQAGTFNLEAALPKLVEVTGMDRRQMAERIACAMKYGKNPAAYLKQLLQSGGPLAEYQRAAVKDHVDRMLGASPGPTRSVPALSACLNPRCGCARLVARGSFHVQCLECGSTFEGNVANEEKGSRKAGQTEAAKAGS